MAQTFKVYASNAGFVGGEYRDDYHEVVFDKERRHDRIYFALQDAEALVQSGAYSYVVVKDWCGNWVQAWHR
jgi:hypothetical protein